VRRAPAAVVAAAATFAVLAAPASSSTTRYIKIGDDYFVEDGSPPTVAVRRGARVKWLWRGDSPHNVTVIRGPLKFKSRTMVSGSYSKVITDAGTYRIVCTIHGARDQSMTLRVQ
jgi:plastocyanin